MTHSNEKSLIMDERVVLWILFVWRKRMKGFKNKNKLSKHSTILMKWQYQNERSKNRWGREKRIQRKCCQLARKGEFSLLNQGEGVYSSYQEKQMQRAHKASPCGSNVHSKWLSFTIAFLHHQYFTSLTGSDEPIQLEPSDVKTELN